mgnify:CR=1 FL=1
MTQARYIQTRYHLREAAESLVVTYWTHDPYHVRQAREGLCAALCGGGDKEILIECLAEVIRTNPDAPAEAVVNALLDTAIPLPEKE